MSSMTRAATAAVLVFGLMAVPVALDGCSAFCEAHRDSVATTPGCHHTKSDSVRIGHPSAACGHDHNGTTATLSAGPTTLVRTLQLTVGVIVTPAPLTRTVSHLTVLALAPPGPAPDALDRSLPLRI